MSKKIIFLLCTISIGIGFSVSHFIGPEEVNNIEVVVTNSEDPIEAIEIKEKIITKYLVEKDPAKRLEISDEIMEKVILLFMANLGIKLTDQEQALVVNPKSYEKYMQEVMTLCPSLPKSTGPEVYLNDGSDELRRKLESQLKTCKQTYGGLNKKPKLKTDEQKRKFINFEDNIFKRFSRRPESLFPFDIYSELWTENVYSGKTQGFAKNFTEAYEGTHEGIFRTRSGEQGYIKISIGQHSESENNKVRLVFSKSSNIGLTLGATYSASHPSGHSNTGKGPCRGMILSTGDNGSGSFSVNRVVHLVKIPGKKGFFGRVYSKDEMVSSFFVMKNFSKKNLNPSKWGRDRGYW